MAILAEEAGEIAEAEAIINAPISTPATIIIPKSAPPASRLTAGRESWSAEMVDLKMLVKAVAEGKQPITFLLPDMTVLNGLARSLKGAMNIPGVAAKSKKV